MFLYKYKTTFEADWLMVIGLIVNEMSSARTHYRVKESEVLWSLMWLSFVLDSPHGNNGVRVLLLNSHFSKNVALFCSETVIESSYCDVTMRITDISPRKLLDAETFGRSK